MVAIRGVLPHFAMGILLHAALASCSSPPKRSIWRDLPGEVRGQIHVNESLIPRFPEDSFSLRRARAWPTVRTYDGEDYHLEFSAYRSEGVQAGLPSLDQIRPGFRAFGAQYARYVDGNPVYRGIRSRWNRDSVLVDRSYTTSARMETWSYHPRGWIMGYARSGRSPSHFSCSQAPTSPLEEYFNEDGYLIGFAVAGQHYWMGAPVTPERFAFEVVSAYPWILTMGLRPESRTTPRISWSNVRPEDRSWVRIQVPRIPERPPLTLEDLPPRRRIEGRDAILRVLPAQAGRGPLRTRYERPDSPGSNVGPTYSWRYDSTLATVTYGTKSYQSYGIDRHGRIHKYTFGSPRTARTLFYDTEGRLLALHLPVEGGTRSYWLGEEMPSREVMLLVQDYDGYSGRFLPRNIAAYSLVHDQQDRH